MNNLTPRQKVERALTVLISEAPFYGTLALGLRPEPSAAHERMATDGARLLYNPDAIAGMQDSELRTVIAHEVSHCALQHHTRMKDRDLKRWNAAADYEANAMLAQAGFKLPSWALHNPDYAGLSAEAIYEKLRQEDPHPDDQDQPASGQGDAQSADGGQGAGDQPGQQQGDASGDASGSQGPGSGDGTPGPGQGPAPGSDPGGMGEILPAPGGEAEQDAEAGRWESAVRAAAAVAKANNAGDYPAELDRLIEKLNEPEVSWREILRQWYDQSANTRTDWSTPNRRHLWRGTILPGKRSDGIGRLVVVGDTSGSFDPECLDQARAEIQSCFDEGILDRLSVVWCDAVVQSVEDYERGDELELEPKGGGGTKFRPALDWAEEHAPDAAAVIYITDLLVQLHDFGDDPGLPVLWAYIGDPARFDELAARCPFGDAVMVTAD